MSRRAKKRHSSPAPLSGARSSQRKQRPGKPKPVLVVVPNEVSGSAAPAAAAPAASKLAPVQALGSLLPPPAQPTAEPPFSDEALEDLELSFFERGSALASGEPASAGAEPSPLSIEDDLALRLTPEQQQRRRWFRRQVSALMAGMAALGTAAIAVRLASLL